MAGLAQSRRWTVLTSDERVERELSERLGVPPLVARVLSARGHVDPAEATAFLEASLDESWEDPLVIPGMSEVADRLDRALDSSETIAVFGDFDVDGMTSTCLLTLALRSLGGDAHPFIPYRFGEGYGLSREALERVVRSCDPDLVVTVDNGIAAANEVDWLLERGIDVVVTDHHEPADLVPVGIPVTDPKLSANCPSHELAGAGVALKLVCELGRRRGIPDLWRSYTDVAALGTLSDMMLLTNENRALVADGVSRMRRATRPGLVALAATAGCDLSTIKPDDLPFSLIPRLNAAGRMGSTDVALGLLLTDDPVEAALLAGELEAVNSERREVESALASDALEEAGRTYDGGRVVVVGGEGWHEGVKGIVASRLVNRYHVPAIVFSIKDGVARGSGRSVGSVDLFHAVEQCSDVLIRFGGHAGAVGVTCEASRIDEFRSRLSLVLGKLPAEQFEDVGEVTALVSLSELTVETIDALERLQPFGQGNKRPLLAVCGVTMRNRACVGADLSHLRFVATDGVSSVPAIFFRAPDAERSCAWDGIVDVVFEAVNETWQGRTKPKLMVKDLLLRDAGGDRDAECDEWADLDAGADAASDNGGDEDARDSLARGPETRDLRERLSALSGEALTDELRGRLIGDRPLLPAQRRALDILASGRSCLSVMATGRGKSLVFHIHAAREAILHHRASVFVFPLRALVADQAFHLREELASVGVGVEVITGETPVPERERVFDALAAGRADIALTTPEFLAIHRADFARSGRVGFLAVDEAHHAGLAAPGSREAYLELPAIRSDLGGPVTLAATATAADDVAQRICSLAGIDRGDVVLDVTSRENLLVDDTRELRDREAALVSIVARGEKCVVYAPTRDSAVSLARTLRHSIPELAARVAYYHAGLPRGVRTRVEGAFRGDGLSCIVSTSAFGEGVNLPGIRHVILYGLPLGRVEFNQMSGRAGRDGAPATIHLLFGSRDVSLGRRILSSAAPSRDDLVLVYRTLMRLYRAHGPISLDDAGIAAEATERASISAIDEHEVSSALTIFSELGFCSVSGWEDGRRIAMAPSPARMELSQSACYLEGMRSRRAFEDFCSWVLESPVDELVAGVRRPISPDFGIIF